MALSPHLQSNKSNKSDQDGLSADITLVSSSTEGLSLGILPAVSCNGIKERNFLVGNVTKSLSLLGSDELNRYFPRGHLHLFVGTWNMQKCAIPDNIDDFLLPAEEKFAQDIYAIGVQEATSDQRAWEIKMQETLGPNHVLAYSVAHGVLHLAIFVRRDLIWFFSNFEDDKVTTRIVSKIKTKGALAVCFQFFGTSFLFVSSHFHSGETNVKERLEDYQKIVSKLQVPRSLPGKIYQNRTKDVTEKFDCIFWFGDLNFRISQPHQHMKEEVENPSACDIREALKCDQLKGCMKRGQIFNDFEEPSITFLPTYKFNRNSDNYDTSQKLRVPSYTDRILHRSKVAGTITCTKYDSITSLRYSDHRPVYALFEVGLKPGRNSIPLSSGQFKHDIYIEAAKRRANFTRTAPNYSVTCNIL